MVSIRVLLYPLYLPHLFLFKRCKSVVKMEIKRDLAYMNMQFKHHRGLLYYLVFTPPYRNLYNYRMGNLGRLIRVIYPQYKSFYISSELQNFGGGGCVINHPYGSIINAKSIGRNFTICQLTTIGNKQHWHNDLIPTIGDNVSLGANVTIVGDITVGDNVIVGAGSVVVKDVPCNCIVAGNPAKVIRYI